MTAGARVRVAVSGAGGRMGSTTCAAVASSPSCILVAGIDPLVHRAGAGERAAGAAGSPGGVPGLRWCASLNELDNEALDVVVDFSVARAVLATAKWCAAKGVHLVCGTTGLDDAELGELGRLFRAEIGPNCVVAPNFAISAVLMMRLAALAAPYFDSIEIVELHHDEKRDAPSGTALETARSLVAARERAGSAPLRADPTTEERLAGARGGLGPAGIRVHAVRLHGLVAHQEVLLGAQGQSLTIRQDSYDRTSFMPGVLLAIEKVGSAPGLSVGLERLLGI